MSNDVVWYFVVTVVPFFRWCLWRTPNTYRKAGIRRGTATSTSMRPGTTSRSPPPPSRRAPVPRRHPARRSVAAQTDGTGAHAPFQLNLPRPLEGSRGGRLTARRHAQRTCPHVHDLAYGPTVAKRDHPLLQEAAISYWALLHDAVAACQPPDISEKEVGAPRSPRITNPLRWGSGEEWEYVEETQELYSGV